MNDDLGDDYSDVMREAQEIAYAREMDCLDFIESGQAGELEETLVECSIAGCSNLVAEKGTGQCDKCFNRLTDEYLTGKPRVRTYGPIPD